MEWDIRLTGAGMEVGTVGTLFSIMLQRLIVKKNVGPFKACEIECGEGFSEAEGFGKYHISEGFIWTWKFSTK